MCVCVCTYVYIWGGVFLLPSAKNLFISFENQYWESYFCLDLNTLQQLEPIRSIFYIYPIIKKNLVTLINKKTREEKIQEASPPPQKRKKNDWIKMETTEKQDKSLSFFFCFFLQLLPKDAFIRR